MKRSDLKPTNPKDRAATNRLDISLFPQTAICYGALGMVEGDAKYGGYNYRVGKVNFSTYVAAALRHMYKCYNGEWRDKKTKVPHLASALACIGIIIDAYECDALIDDRPPQCEVDLLLTEFSEIVTHLHAIFPDGPARYTQIGSKHGLQVGRKADSRTPRRKSRVRKARR